MRISHNIVVILSMEDILQMMENAARATAANPSLMDIKPHVVFNGRLDDLNEKLTATYTFLVPDERKWNT